MVLCVCVALALTANDHEIWSNNTPMDLLSQSNICRLEMDILEIVPTVDPLSNITEYK